MPNIELAWVPKPRLNDRSGYTMPKVERNKSTTNTWAVMQHSCQYGFFSYWEAVDWIDEAGGRVQSVGSVLSDLCHVKFIRKLEGGPGRYMFEGRFELEDVEEAMRVLKEARDVERRKALRERQSA